MDFQNLEFFEGIDPVVIKEIEKGCSKKDYAAGETIFEKGSRGDYLYVLDQGSIDLTVREEDRILCTLKQPGEVFGWSSMVEKGFYTTSAVCKAATSVLRISNMNIVDIFNRYPGVAVTFYRRIGSIFSKRISKALE